MRFVIAYDVSDDNSRARLAALLAAWGDRIQKSVFECTLSTDELAALVERATRWIDYDRDSLHVVPVCQTCDAARVVVGQAVIPHEDPFWIV